MCVCVWSARSQETFQSSQPADTRLGSENRGHQLLMKMGELCNVRDLLETGVYLSCYILFAL